MNLSPLPPNPNAGIPYPEENLHTICLAGGCFWGTQAYLARVKGVAKTQCGYANGRTAFPTYEQVCRENTGHAEAVMVQYDPTVLPLYKLLDAFWNTIDPTLLNRQGNDIGAQYRSGIYYTNPEDLSAIALSVDAQQGKYRSSIVTEVMPLVNYYPAEGYHQEYLEKNPGGYCHVSFTTLPTIINSEEKRYE